jgi:hypothetical protein
MKKAKQKKSEGTLTKNKRVVFSKRHAAKVKDIIFSTILKEIH